jgi:hypothetical protein
MHAECLPVLGDGGGNQELPRRQRTRATEPGSDLLHLVSLAWTAVLQSRRRQDSIISAQHVS